MRTTHTDYSGYPFSLYKIYRDSATYTTKVASGKGEINALSFDNKGNLYAGGAFDSIGSISAKNIARWDGKNWHSIGSVRHYSYWRKSKVTALLFSDSTLFVGGDFLLAGGEYSPYIARINLYETPNKITGQRNSILTNQGIRFRVAGSTLHVNNIKQLDQIFLFSLSGRCLFQASAAENISLRDMSPQPLIIRIARAGKTIATSMVIRQ